MANGPENLATSTFLRYAAAGFAQSLLPIIPPDAELAPQSTVQRHHRGKVPGVFHEFHKTWSGMSRWRDRSAGLKEIKSWSRWPTSNIGLQGQMFPAVDIDVTVKHLADAIELIALKILGPAPTRIRSNSTRRLLAYRVDLAGSAFISKQRLWWQNTSGAGEAIQAIEVLGRGQQYLIEGVHPSGVPYTWNKRTKSLLALTADNLTPITTEQVQDFLSRVEKYLESENLAVFRGANNVNGGSEQGRLTIPHADHEAKDILELAQAVRSIPNENLDYDTWMRLTVAIKAACGGSDVFFDEVYLPWALRYETNTEDQVRTKWASFADSTVGADMVYSFAREYGFNGGVEDFNTVEITPQDEQRALLDMLDEYSPERKEQVKLKSRGSPLERDEFNLVQSYTDQDLALRFIQNYGDQFRFVPNWQRWLAWSGSRWVPENEENPVAQAASAFSRKIAIEVQETIKGTEGKRLASRILDAGQPKRIMQLASMQGEVIRRPDIFDADPMVLNTKSGIVNLETGRLYPPSPSYHCIHITHSGYGGKHTLWNEFLREATGGDKEFEDYLQRVAGYMITGNTDEQMMFYFYGPTGTGKSTFQSILHRVMGTYSQPADVNEFMATKNERHPAGLATLNGKRLVSCEETDKGRPWNEARIKLVTGKTPISARFMGRDPFVFLPQFKLGITSNHKPEIANLDAALRRRITIIPFRHKPPKVVRQLQELIVNGEGGGVLAWAVAGTKKWLERGLERPTVVEAATQEYFNTGDGLLEWLEDATEREDGAFTSYDDLFNSWTQYCRKNNIRDIGTRPDWIELMAQRGFYRFRRDGSRGLTGIALRDTSAEHNELTRMFPPSTGLETRTLQ